MTLYLDCHPLYHRNKEVAGSIYINVVSESQFASDK